MSVETLSRALPAPIYDPIDREPVSIVRDVITVVQVAPPYGQRKGWTPRKPQDFGDGGAFPEIHVPQFPLGMGLNKSTDSKSLAKTLDADGAIQYDAIARYGQRSDKIIHSKLSNQSGRLVDLEDDELKKPDLEELKEISEKTKMALEKLVASKLTAAMPVAHADKKQAPTYIRYTPSQQGVAFNSGAKQSIIRMVDIQKDPMEPPRFRTNKKIPRGPPSPPAPVLHSPNRKVTVKEQQEWKIPPCISNWKNAKGFTIPLDKRLAADGRGLQQVHINENFAKLAESLYIADRKAREAVEARAQLEKKITQKEKEQKEETLRILAQKAREERAGLHRNQQNVEEDEGVMERDELRRERNKERQRDRNINNAAPDKRKRLAKEKERDISEKIALGLPNNSKTSNQLDQRLFNQSKGMDSGFGGGDDESYNVYDAAWRGDKNIAQAIYRPSKNVNQQNEDIDAIANNNRFVGGKGFSGADSGVRRDGPVAFEKDEEDDLFGLNKFLDAAKRATKRTNQQHSTHNKRSRRDS